MFSTINQFDMTPNLVMIKLLSDHDVKKKKRTLMFFNILGVIVKTAVLGTVSLCY